MTRVAQSATGALLVAAVALAGCRARPVQPVELGLSLSPESIEFGRVREGTTSARNLEITNISKVKVHLTFKVDAPFNAASTLDIGPTETAPLSISFTAGDSPASGQLSITSERGLTLVALSGTGVHPLTCTPSATCRVSTWDLDTGLCIERVATDGAACDPNNQCLEAPTCQSGACVGQPRTCDDHDACTVDACSATTGCAHPRRVCPTPSNPCHVATCDPITGCGEGLAADLTPCGNFDCVTQRVCLGGTCSTRPTPDGFICAPPTPCNGVSQCFSHKCVQPAAVPLQSNFRQKLPAPWSARSRLIGADNALYFSGCGGVFDAGCGVTSFTSTGFERFSAASPDGGEPEVLSANSRTLVIRAAQGISLLSSSTGLARENREADDDPAGEQFVLLDDFQLLSLQRADGGTRLLWNQDAGRDVWFDEPLAALAADEEGRVFVASADAGRLTRLTWLVDGGVERETGTTAGAATHLAAGLGLLALDSTGFQALDGGVWSLPATRPDGGPRTYDAQSALLSDQAVTVLERRCLDAGTACADTEQQVVMSAWQANSLVPLWEVALFDAGTPSRLLTLVRTPLAPGAALSAIDASNDAGVSVWLLGYGDGQEVFRCEVPTATPPLASLLYRGSLFLVRGFDGGSVMESYSLQGVPLSERGWPQANGVAGSRRAR